MSLILCLVLVTIFSYFAYRYYRLHQIKKKLGWMPIVPGWPIIGNGLEFGGTEDLLNDVSRMLKKHGKLILTNLLSQPNIFTTDYDFIEFILTTQNILCKTEDYKFVQKWLGTGLLTSEGAKWRQRRRLTTPAFHFSILEQFVESFESNGKILIEKLKKEVARDAVDVYPLINLYALDVICETAMGVKVQAQKYENSDYVNNVKLMCRIGVVRTTSLIKSNDFLYILTPDYYKEKKAVQELHKVTYSVIDSRLKKLVNKVSGGGVKDTKDDIGRKEKLAFLDILLQSTVDGMPLTREDIREEVDTFMFEGHDTTTSAMSFSLHLLANYPKVQQRALEEQKYIFSDDRHRIATYKDLQDMKYLECVIKETLRLYPSVPLFGRYVDEDVTYKGNILPKGTNIYIFSYGVLRDPEHFPDPDKFDPDRFEKSDGKKPFSYIPFSAGPRNCIGQKFAMLEMKSTLSKILRNFELLPSVPEHKLVLLEEAVLKSKTGMKLRLLERK